MRYSEGPGTSVQLIVHAPPEVVWSVVTDIDLPARFSTEFLGGRWVDTTEARLGAAFVGRSHHPAIGEWETTSYVVEFEPPSCFAWAVGDPEERAATWRYLIHEVPEGTLVSFQMRAGPARSGLSAAIEARPEREDRIIARRLAEHESNMKATLEGIKLQSESAAGCESRAG